MRRLPVSGVGACRIRCSRVTGSGYRRPGPELYGALVTSPTDYLRLTLDPVRLAVLGHAAVAPVDSEVLASRLGIKPRRILVEVGRLREAGLLDDDLRLDRRALRRVAEAMPRAVPADPSLLHGEWTAEELETLGKFFSGSRLIGIPSQASKRRVVLERVAQEFEPGLRYPEREVNELLHVFHPDHALLRRLLVEDELLTRAEGVYWRTGGRF